MHLSFSSLSIESTSQHVECTDLTVNLHTQQHHIIPTQIPRGATFVLLPLIQGADFMEMPKQRNIVNIEF